MKYTKEKLQEAVKQSVSIAGVCRFFGKNVSGSIHTHLSKLIKRHEIDTAHFTGSATNAGENHKGGHERQTAEQILKYVSSGDNREKTHKLVRALIEIGVAYRCEICLCDGTWQGKKIILHVDHKDGDWRNNKKDNLRFLCPNCHSQTDNYGSKNIKSSDCGEKANAKGSEPFEELSTLVDTTLLIRTCTDCGCSISKKATRCKRCKTIHQQIGWSKRPSLEQLTIDIEELSGNKTAIGRKYGVSDNAVRKWIKFYAPVPQEQRDNA